MKREQIRWRKSKAYFQLVIYVFSLIGFFYHAFPVVAEEQKVCCSETTSNEHCQYVEKSQCKQGALEAATSCEQTSFCKLGCGFDSGSGRCFKNTPRFSCQNQENCTWSEGSTCDIPQCAKGCCVLSNECSYVTQLQCKRITSNFEDVQMNFNPDVKTEAACINNCRSIDKGACVKDDGSCTFTTRESCPIKERTNLTAGQAQVGFHSGVLCSNAQLGTTCAPQQTTGCLPDKDGVYWFDSCGNPENIYSSDKRTSYNNGLILSKDKSCNPDASNINSEGCGNCNFALGSLCDAAEKGVNPSYGKYACKDLSCKDITIDDNTPSARDQGTTKKLGESWCAYDSIPGYGQDPVGSRHYRRLCINGQELTEPCKDFREELCVQGVQGQPPLSTAEAFKVSQGNYIEAICRDNRWEDCRDMKEKNDCERLGSRDCMWLGKDEKNGLCVPFVPPGLKFWTDTSSGATPTSDAKAVCEKGNQECVVAFERGGLHSDFQCVSNCECLKKSWLESVNFQCRSLGDCGAYVNILGKGTLDGLEVSDNHPHPLTDDDINKLRDELIKPKKGDQEYANKFNAFFKKAAPGLLVMGGTALGSAIFNLGGTTFLSNLGTGFISGGAGIVGGIQAAATDTTFSQVIARSFPGLVQSANIPVTAGIQQGSSFTFSQLQTVFDEKTLGNLVKNSALKLSESGSTYQATRTIATPELQSLVKPGTTEIPTTIGTATSETAVVLGYALQIINIIGWIYTIYSLLDVLLAKTKTEKITVACNPWVPPAGGKDCEQCQEKGKECSEYRCRSLGQLCKLVNPGTKQELCYNANPNDANAPIIIADENALRRGYSLTEVKGEGFSLNQLVEPFTPVSVGIKTNEPSQCKYSLNHSISYTEMTQYFGDSLYAYNHTITFGLPATLAQPDVLKVTNNGKYTVYVRCQDGNANKNNRDYYISFGIKPGPDLTAPVVEATSIQNGAFAPAGVNMTGLSIYMNEPSACKWSDIDEEFSAMENFFQCSRDSLPSTNIFFGLYACSTILDNIQDNKLNSYSIRCQDKPSESETERNVNEESYVFTLHGTQPLTITSISPSGELFTASPTLKVVTAKGALGGNAICGYTFDEQVDPIEFLRTNSTVHEQPFTDLTSGNYNAFVTCGDVAGNIAKAKTSFKISVDIQGPALAQVYTDNGLLHLVTEEESTCEYSTSGAFTFGSGIRMTNDNSKAHEANLESTVFYVTCRDAHTNDRSFVIYV